MSATDELRRMLDERGVEHYDGTESTLWGYEDYNEFTGIYRFSADETSDGYMQVRLWRVTPEQAIAATLGSCNCSNDCTNSERMDVPCLPHFWTHDGTLHIEATRMPARIVVCEGGTCEFVPKRELYVSEAENAKLRELVRILAYCMSEDRDCDRCALNGADMPTPRISACDSLPDLMRELEVDA